MAASPKDVEIKARVSSDMKNRVEQIADDRDESISVIVREALQAYLAKRTEADTASVKSKVAEDPGKYRTGSGKKASKRKVAVMHVPGRTIYRDFPLGDGPAGLPCHGEFRPDSWEERVRINATKYPHAAFALRVRGHSMTGRKIQDGDILIFALPEQHEPVAGDVVAACIDGEVTIKTLVKQNGKTTLKAENPAYPDPVVTKNSAVQGVMIGKLKQS